MIQKQGQNDFVLPFPEKRWTGLEQKKKKKTEKIARERKAINISYYTEIA